MMDAIKDRRQNVVPVDLVQVGGEIAAICVGWTGSRDSKIYSYEQALKADATVAQWIVFTQNPALGSHPYILEDGPELLKVPGPHADQRAEVLEGMYADRCTSFGDARILGREGGQVSAT
jgi:hypothetical protein